MAPTSTSSQQSHPDPPKTRSKTSRSRKGKSSKSSKPKTTASKTQQEEKVQTAPPPATFSSKTAPLLDTSSICSPKIPTSISVHPDKHKSNTSVYSNKTGASNSNVSNFVTLKQFEDLKQNMATQ